MSKITLDQLRQMGTTVKGSINKIYLHWSAGPYANGDESLLFLNDYHISIDADGCIYNDGNPLTTHKNHTYMRNTGAVAVSMMCCADASGPSNMGTEPPADEQIESMARVVAVLCKVWELPIDLNYVMTHAEAGNNLDGYDPGYEPNGCPNGIYGPTPNPDGSPGGDVERWDLWVLKQGDPIWSGGNIIRGKALYYQQNGVGG
jgi:hypothetical protein